MEHGTLDIPVEYLCDVAHARVAALGYEEPGVVGYPVMNNP